VVDSIAKQCVILIDQSKVVSKLGLAFSLAVEVLPFALSPVLRALVNLGGVPEIRTALRKDGPVITELGNMVVDIRCNMCSFTRVHLTVDAKCKLLLFLVPL
jgi:ribose 5-phosphate isomerase A